MSSFLGEPAHAAIASAKTLAGRVQSTRRRSACGSVTKNRARLIRASGQEAVSSLGKSAIPGQPGRGPSGRFDCFVVVRRTGNKNVGLSVCQTGWLVTIQGLDASRSVRGYRIVCYLLDNTE